MIEKVGRLLIDYFFQKLGEYEVYDLHVSVGSSTSRTDHVWRIRRRL